MLQTLIMLIMFAANLVHAAWTDYEENRDLALDAADIETLQIEAGAGSLEVTGVAGTERILVSALLRIPGADADEARQIIGESLVLSLDRTGRNAQLKGFFKSDRRWRGDSPGVNLEIRVPERLSLDIEDSSGAVELRDVRGDIRLDDRSGSIVMTDVGGSLNVTDGSGPIVIDGAGGDIEIVDGSGSISVERVQGSVTIEDGSGSIDAREISGDLFIPESGSGSLDYSNVAGRVEADD